MRDRPGSKSRKPSSSARTNFLSSLLRGKTVLHRQLALQAGTDQVGLNRNDGCLEAALVDAGSLVVLGRRVHGAEQRFRHFGGDFPAGAELAFGRRQEPSTLPAFQHQPVLAGAALHEVIGLGPPDRLKRNQCAAAAFQVAGGQVQDQGVRRGAGRLRLRGRGDDRALLVRASITHQALKERRQGCRQATLLVLNRTAVGIQQIDAVAVWARCQPGGLAANPIERRFLLRRGRAFGGVFLVSNVDANIISI